MPSQDFAAGTDPGTRDNNEDTYVCNDENGLWLVLDGVGGLGFGEVASAIAAYSLTTMILGGAGVNQAIEAAHKKIIAYASDQGRGKNMGTTLVLLLSHGSLYNIFWVGDCRAYSFDGSLTRLTRDHSVVQTLVDKGELTAEEAEVDPRRSAITKALGIQQLDTVRADSISQKWSPDQKILLCSDGLSDFLDDDEIGQIFRSETSDQKAVDKLIAGALANGGGDNITVVVVSAPSSTTGIEADDVTEVPEELA